MNIYRFVKPASVAFMLLGVLVILGGITNITVFSQPVTPTPATNFFTAIFILLGGILLRAFYYVTMGEKQHVSTIKMMVVTCLLLMIAFPLTAEYFFNLDTGLLNVGHVALDESESSIPSIGSLIATWLLFFMGFFASIGMSVSKTARGVGMLLLVVGGIALLGYVINAPTLYFLSGKSMGMSLHAAAGFSLLGYFFLLLGIRPHVSGQPIREEKK